MQKQIVFLTLVIALLVSSTASARPSTDNDLLFPNEAAAKKHCPNGVPVWLNTKNRTYYFKGQKQYGKAKSGAYVCKKDADKMGEREDRSGH